MKATNEQNNQSEGSRRTWSARVRPAVTLIFMLLIAVKALALNLSLLDTLDPSNHELLDVEIEGSLMVVPGGLGGAVFFDITNLEQPAELNSFMLANCDWGRSYNWELAGDLAFGTARECGIGVVDIANPHQLQLLDMINDPPYAYEDVEAHGDLLVTAARSDGVCFFDVADPENSELLSVLPTTGAWSVALRDSLVYVADGEAGLSVIDFHDPLAPDLLGVYSAAGSAKDVRLVGDQAWLALGSSGVAVYDLSDPAVPTLLDIHPTTGLATRLAPIDEGVAVSAWEEVEVLAWNGDSLARVGHKNTGGRVMAVGGAGDIVYSAEWGDLQVFRYGEISGPDLDLSPRELLFPDTPPDSSSVLGLSLTNNGGAFLAFNQVSITHPDFSLESQPVDLFPGEAIQLNVQYDPVQENASGRLEFHTNDPDEPVADVDLFGNNPNALQVGDQAPEFALPVVANGGGEFDLAGHQGEVVVLAFFATW